MTTQPILLRFSTSPYTFVDVSGFTTVGDAPEGDAKGIYVWSIEQPDGFLVNYLGKTSAKTGFRGRLSREFKDWQKGLYRFGNVDLSQFVNGRRVVLDSVPCDHLQRELGLLKPMYRLFLAPLDIDKSLILHVESFLVNELRRTPRTFDFLCNRDKHRAYKPRPDRPRVAISGDSPRLIGFEHLRADKGSY